MSEVGVAVVGAGGWGKNHVRTFANLQGAALRWVCDRSPAVRDGIAAAHPGVSVTDDVGRVWSDPGVQAVVVATDAAAHFAVARDALEAGKDVLVEKPLTLAPKDGAALCAVAEAADRIAMVGHLLLYHPAVERLHALTVDGTLGEVLYLHTQRTNLGVVRKDENAWWSLAPHDLSLASWLLDAEPEAVSAQGGTFLQEGVEDVVFATVYFPGGRIAHCHTSWLDPHKQRRLTVVGSKKMAVFDDASADQKLVLFDKGVEPPPATVSYSEGVRVRTGDITIPALRMQEPLRREAEAFLRAVTTRERPRADARSGLAVVRALEAGSRSLREDGRRVPVAEVS